MKYFLIEFIAIFQPALEAERDYARVSRPGMKPNLVINGRYFLCHIVSETRSVTEGKKSSLRLRSISDLAGKIDFCVGASIQLREGETLVALGTITSVDEVSEVDL